MFATIGLNFMKFWASLTPAKMINILLLVVIIFISIHASKMQDERDKSQDNYDSLYLRYQDYIDKTIEYRDSQSKDCNERLMDYSDKKNAEIEELSREFRVKYVELLKLYTNLNKRK